MKKFLYQKLNIKNTNINPLIQIIIPQTIIFLLISGFFEGPQEVEVTDPSLEVVTEAREVTITKNHSRNPPMAPTILAPQEAKAPSNIEPSVPAGSLSRCITYWRKFISNPFILRIVEEGYKIQLLSSKFFIPQIITTPSKSKLPLLLNEIQALLSSEAISIVSPLESDIVSRIFTVPKPNSKVRMIIDLSLLNLQINKVSFKMEDKEIIKSIINKNDYLASIDLKDAFFSVSLHKDSKRLTCFELNGVRYCYNVLPFGLTSSPRIFSKLLKPVISYLRTSGVKITSYLDDIFLCANTYEKTILHLNR